MKRIESWIGTVAIACAACGDDGGTGGASSTSGTTGAQAGATTAASTASSTTASTSAAGSGTGGEGPTAQTLATFDAAAFELPEGLAIAGDRVLVGFAFGATIDAFDRDGGGREPFATFPVPAQNTGFFTGVTVDAAGSVYGALVSFTPPPTAGVYRVPPTGGEAELFASHPQMVFPNGFAWNDDGDLFVTDSASGIIFRVSPDGTTAPWFTSPSLTGDPTACGQPADSTAVGANGIVWTVDAIYVASSDRAFVGRIPVGATGDAGALEMFAGPDCALLGGIDGIVRDDDGTFVGAVNRADRLVRIDATGDVSVWLEGAPLDFPASLAFAGSGPNRALYVTSFGLARALAGRPAFPALVRISD